jgi:anti-sigma-K factor RskA
LTNGGHIREEDLLLLAVGALPETECAAARAHAAECAECGAKFAAERGRAALLALAVPQERPAATVKAELLAKIRAERNKEELHRWPVKISVSAAAGNQKEERVERRTPARGELPGWSQWVLAPVAALLLVAAVVERRENRRLAAELESTNHQMVEMVSERLRTEMMVDVLSAPDTVSVKLTGSPQTEMATGMVRYNARKGVVLYTAVLPALPTDKTYQMWLVPVMAAPISAGVFRPGAHGSRQLWSAEVPLNTEVKAFAVTIEPAGGVPQPTGAKVLAGAS